MFKRDTEELIKFIESSQYTDIIFDFDETIVQLLIDWSYLKIDREQLAKKYDEENYLKENGWYAFDKMLVEKYSEAWKIDLDKMFMTAEENHFLGLNENTDLIAFIKENAKKYNFYVLSNNTQNTLYRVISELEMTKCFHIVLWRDNVSAPKPNPEGIETIIKSQQLKKENTLMVWDSETSDIAAAERAEVDSFLIDMHL